MMSATLNVDQLHQCSNSELEQRMYQDIMDEWPRLGMAQYHHRNTKGQVMSFEGRPWLVPIYMDNSDQIVIQKASQIGLSEWALCEVFTQARAGRSVLYVLPTDVVVYDFTPRRVDKLINMSPYYRENSKVARKDSDTKKQKTLFGVDCHFVGSNAVNNFYEKPCDILVIDEMDRCTVDNLSYAYDRLGASTISDKDVWRKIGNPSFRGWGIAEEYEKSDQMRWQIKCEACQAWQEIDWFQNVVNIGDDSQPKLRNSEGHVVCGHCNRSINRLAKGQWVAKYPSRTVRGYQASKIFGDARQRDVIPQMFAEYIAALNDPILLQRFYNNILGVPYDAPGARISEAMLQNCAVEYTMPLSGNGCFGGADVGSVLHAHFAEIKDGKIRSTFIDTVQTFEELSQVASRHGVAKGVIDALPETHACKQFVFANSGWLMARYSSADQKTRRPKIDHVKRTIDTGRTESCDGMYATHANGGVEYPKAYRQIGRGEFVSQMTAPVRVFKQAANRGQGGYVWDEGAQADHYFHATNYLHMAVGQLAGDNITVM